MARWAGCAVEVSGFTLEVLLRRRPGWLAHPLPWPAPGRLVPPRHTSLRESFGARMSCRTHMHTHARTCTHTRTTSNRQPTMRQRQRTRRWRNLPACNSVPKGRADEPCCDLIYRARLIEPLLHSPGRCALQPRRSSAPYPALIPRGDPSRSVNVPCQCAHQYLGMPPPIGAQCTGCAYLRHGSQLARTRLLTAFSRVHVCSGSPAMPALGVMPGGQPATKSVQTCVRARLCTVQTFKQFKAAPMLQVSPQLL